MAKVSVIGAGNVGASLAQRLVERNLGDIVLLDIIDGLPQGKALDILQSTSITGASSRITGTNSYQQTANSDVIVITSGASRKPGMTRNELLKTNVKIISQVTRSAIEHSLGCIIIMVTNPVDAMTYLALKVSGLAPSRVMGLSGVLDSARFASFIAAELKVPAAEVSAWVLGEHGHNMVVIPRLASVSGKPLTNLLSQEAINRLVNRTVNGGAEIVSLLKMGSAFYAPSAAAASMIEAIVQDKKETMPCTTHLQGEYGLADVAIGVPVRLGIEGIEQIVELELIQEERAALKRSAEAVKGLISTMVLG
jgi:malate dehydrogenase